VGAPLDELRETVTALPPAPPAMAAYLEQVRTGAYAIVDGDVEALKAAGCSEDEIFEQTVAVAVGEGLRRLDAGLRALG
jgi:alkylhydroperoxidase family enzyme